MTNVEFMERLRKERSAWLCLSAEFDRQREAAARAWEQHKFMARLREVCCADPARLTKDRARQEYECKVAALPYSVKSIAGASASIQPDADGMRFSAYGSTFSNVDLQNDVILPNAYRQTIRECNQRVPLLWAHSVAEPLGSALELREDSRGLLFTGVLRREVQRASEIAALIRHRDIDSFSIGFRIPEGGAKRRRDGVREISQIDLLEISVVVFAANPEARLV